MAGVSDSIPKSIAGSIAKRVSQISMQGGNAIITVQELITENSILINTETNVQIIKE